MSNRAILGHYFGDNFSMGYYRADLPQRPDGSGGTWFYWNCNCEPPGDLTHGFRTYETMRLAARAHIASEHEGEEKK